MTTRKNTRSSSTELVATGPPGELAAIGDMDLLAETLVDQARADGIALTGEGGLLTKLIAQVLETVRTTV